MESALKFRAFEELLQVPGTPNVWKVSGTIADGTFVVSVTPLNMTVSIVADDVDEDDWGTFAMLHSHQQDLVDGWVLRIEFNCDKLDVNDPEEPGAALSFLIPGDRSTYTAAAARQGVDPAKVNLIVPIQAGFTIYFNSEGKVDGYSGPITRLVSSRTDDRQSEPPN